MPCGANEVYTDFGCFPNDPVGFVQKFYGVGLGFVAGVALLALIWGGYSIMTSRVIHIGSISAKVIFIMRLLVYYLQYSDMCSFKLF